MKRASIVLLLAGVLAAGLTATSAEAGHRWRPVTIYDEYAYYPGPGEELPQDYYGHMGLPGLYEPEFDDQYYVPAYKPPTAKKPTIDQAPKRQTAAPAASMACGKAAAIVTGFGFAGVKPADCEGKVYAFNAERGGKTFLVRLNSANGELTEVKKQP